MKRFATMVFLVLIMFAAAYTMYSGTMGYGSTSPEDWDTPPYFSVDENVYICAGSVVIKTELGPSFHEAGTIDETNDPSDDHLLGAKYYKSKDDPSILYVYQLVYIRNIGERYRYVSYNNLMGWAP